MFERRGFTLIEMLIAVIVIGILASIALPRYVVVVERARSSEARNILGQIRAAELAYYLEFDQYTTSRTNLQLNSVPIGTACNSNFHFNYSISVSGSTFTANAFRCSTGGKSPNVASNRRYRLNMTDAGVLNSNVSSYL